MVAMRWETDTRYYGCALHKDLLGDLILFQYWGGRFNGLGNQSLKVVRSQVEANDLIDQLNKARIKRGYHLVRGSENAGI